jgi:beta-glucanase (GH16 family)
MRTVKVDSSLRTAWSKSARLALFGAVCAASVACSQQEAPSENSDTINTNGIGETNLGLSSSYNSPYAQQFVNAGYVCKVNDEFGGVESGGQAKTFLDSTKWMFENIYVNNEGQNYTSRQCADPAYANGNWNYCVQNGYLTIRAINDGIDCTNNTACGTFWDGNGGYRSFSSGRIISKHKVALQKGYVEFRARLPFQGVAKTSGVWPAIWFLNDQIHEGPAPGGTPWPWAPEFDLLEWQSPNGKMASNAIFIGNDGNMDACNNWPEGGSADCSDQNGAQSGGRGIFKVNDWSAQSAYQGWHIYGLEWTDTYMKPYIDGVLQGTVSTTGGATEFNAPMFIIMNLALGGDLGGTIAVTDWSKVTLDVDYMRWYQYWPGSQDTCADPAGGGGGGGAPAATCNDGMQNQGEYGVDCGGPCAPCAATAIVYHDCNYGGYAVSLPVGDYNMGDLNARGIANDDLSAIKVAPGYQVVLYQDINFSGFTTTLTGQTNCLTDTSAGRSYGTWNDDVTALRVQAVSTSQPPASGVGHTFRAETGVGAGTQFEYPTANGSTGTTVGYFDSGDTITFNNVNLTGVGGLNMRLAGANSGGVMEVHADSATGTLLGSYTMAATGSWQTWADRSMSFSTSVSGIHNLVLSGGGTGVWGILNIETFTLVSTAPQPATCSDGIQNQGEAGVDCGGPCSAACGGGSGFMLVGSSLNGGPNTGLEGCSEGGLDVMDVGNGEYIYFNNVNFSGIGSFELRVAGALYASTIELHRDSTTGPLLASCSAPVTGGWQNWQSVTCSLTEPQSGTGTLYLLFKGTNATGGMNGSTWQLHNLRYIKGIPGTVACSDTCSAHNYACGSFTNNCGVNLNCGTCASGWTCSSSKTCTPPPSSSSPGNLTKSGASTAGAIGNDADGLILESNGASICWSNVNMNGNTQVTVNYGNGEAAGETFKVTYNGAQIGSTFTNAYTGGFSVYQAAQFTFGAQSGFGTLCVVATSCDNWNSKISSVSFK